MCSVDEESTFHKGNMGSVKKFPAPEWCEVKVLSKDPTIMAQVGIMGLAHRQRSQEVERKL